MPTWTFSGVLLPAGVEGQVELGTGPKRALPGGFALPGLVDAHCHLTVAADDAGPYLGDIALALSRLEENAKFGVTVIRDVGGRAEVTLQLGLAVDSGHPRVYAAGRFFAPARHYFPRMYEPVESDRLLEAVAHQLEAGATWVKLIGDFRPVDEDGIATGPAEATYVPDLVGRVVEVAHQHQARVAVHTNTTAVSSLVEVGIDSVEHGTSLTADDLMMLGSRGGAWTPTLCASLGTGPKLARDAGQSARSGLMADLLPVAVDAGVRVLAGSDVVGSIHDEIRLLIEHGLTPDQAMRAASSDGRDYLGEPPDGDLVTYARDPRDDPSVLAAPAAVIVRGTRVR